MKIVKGNIWDCYDMGYYMVVPTNGVVNKKGLAVMGAGLAKQVAEKFPEIPLWLGKKLNRYGNIVFCNVDKRIITFPVKHSWKDQASLYLIEESARTLGATFSNFDLVIPKVGCGNGRLEWSLVEPILDRYLGNSVRIVDFK